MKLIKLHIAHRRPRPVSHRDPIPRRHRRIRRIAIDLPRASTGQQHRPRLHHPQPSLTIQQRSPHHAPILDDQIHTRRPLHQLNPRNLPHMPQQRHRNLPPGRIAIRMQNPRQAMRALARPQQFSTLAVLALRVPVERRPPLQQLLHPLRPLLQPAPPQPRDSPAHRPPPSCPQDAARHPPRRPSPPQSHPAHKPYSTPPAPPWSPPAPFPHPPAESPHSVLQSPPQSPENQPIHLFNAN